MIVQTFLFCSFICFGVSLDNPKINAARDILAILNDENQYDKAIFPKTSGPVEVDINMYLRGMEIDDVNMRMNVDMTFRMMWRDPRIFYNEAGISSVRFTDYNKFWLPDPFFKGSVETVQLKTVHPEAYIGVNSRGNITFSTRFRVTTKCIMDLRRFPHDHQTCQILVASYGYATDDIVFNFKRGTPIELTKRLSISNYILEGYETESCSSKTSTGEYACLAVSLNLKRNFSTYLIEWYIPCMCFVIIALFSELISVEALLPRLVLTLGPLLTLTASSISYAVSLAPVAYTTALDLFTGISLFTIFITCLHVIVGFYYANKEPLKSDEAADPEGAEEGKWAKIKSKLAKKGDYLARIIIIGFYAIFIFLYFLAYSTM